MAASNTCRGDNENYPVPKTDKEKLELARAGYEAITRLLSAIRVLGKMTGREDLDDELGVDEFCIDRMKAMILDAAEDDATLLFEMIANYLPAMLNVSTDGSGVAAIERAYRCIRKADREGRFAL